VVEYGNAIMIWWRPTSSQATCCARTSASRVSKVVFYDYDDRIPDGLQLRRA
jgi:hypothetical protein